MRPQTPDAVSVETAAAIDKAWLQAGCPPRALRLYGLRGPGNRTITLLGAPDAPDAPSYVYSDAAATPRYIHLTGPTLADWRKENAPC